jgi:hypothetical protein
LSPVQTLLLSGAERLLRRISYSIVANMRYVDTGTVVNTCYTCVNCDTMSEQNFIDMSPPPSFLTNRLRHAES